MRDETLIVFTFFSVLTAGAAVMALLLLGFYREYRKSYLLHWTLAWTATAVYHLAAAISAALAIFRHLGPLHPGRIAATLIAGPASYLQFGWLLFGVYELVRRRPVRFRESELILIGLAGVGLITSLGSFGPSPAVRYFVADGVHGFIGATVLLIGAAGVWRNAKRRGSIGFTLITGALLLYGIEQLHYFGISVAWLITGQEQSYSAYLGFADFVIQTMLGTGMITCLLEDEREASELATVEIEHLAYHDSMTGLPNRPLYMDRLIVALAQAARANQKLAVFFLDLDRFKDINDSLGHTVGDALLKAVADRIRRCVREGDTIARFGGDEFTLMIPKIENVEDAAKIAQKIIETLKIPFTLGERELFVTTSIGISLYPIDGTDPDTLVRNADTAMYRAKDSGRDNYQLYAPAMNAHALERLALENMLRKALTQKELVVYYQPLIDATSRMIVGVEALIRWNHPQLGLLSPAHFISVAELSGLIVPIGNWVLRTACKQVKAWHKRLDYDLTVSVNLSARQFSQPDLVEQVRRVLQESGLNPSCLELEITESNAMQNAENTIYTLRDLKTIGVRISMDDFGTGYSSLNYLKRFPIDTLKLDQSFVREVTTDKSDAAIVSAVITMAHSLNLEVVAEGVETEGQLDFLQRHHCDRIQGYLFSAPLSAEDLEPYVMAQKAIGQATG
jgi:diguanylate cyclase (GGDEF)-like protein